MYLDCEICGKETNVTAIYCCNGNNCSCSGLPINEGLIVCDTCRDMLLHIRDINKNKTGNSGYLVLSKNKLSGTVTNEYYFEQIEE